MVILLTPGVKSDAARIVVPAKANCGSDETAEKEKAFSSPAQTSSSLIFESAPPKAAQWMPGLSTAAASVAASASVARFSPASASAAPSVRSTAIGARDTGLIAAVSARVSGMQFRADDAQVISTENLARIRDNPIAPAGMSAVPSARSAKLEPLMSRAFASKYPSPTANSGDRPECPDAASKYLTPGGTTSAGSINS